MSRSFKHTPVYKGDKDRSAKKYANRRIYAIIVPGVNRYGEENPVKIFQIGQKFGGNAIEVSK